MVEIKRDVLIEDTVSVDNVKVEIETVDRLDDEIV